MKFIPLATYKDHHLWGTIVDKYQFVISHSDEGYRASWKHVAALNSPAVFIDGDPFRSLQAAESACRRMYKTLMNPN